MFRPRYDDDGSPEYCCDSRTTPRLQKSCAQMEAIKVHWLQQSIHLGWRRGVRDAQERFDGFEEFVALQRQDQPLQATVPRLDDALAEPAVFVQVHRGTVEVPHQQEVDDAKVLELDEHGGFRFVGIF